MNTAAIRMRTINLVDRVPTYVWYIAIFIFIALTYNSNIEFMVRQDAWLQVIKTNATVNFVLLLLIYNKLLNSGINRLKIKAASFKGLLIWAVGIILFLVVMRAAGGFVTIFD